MKYSKLFWELFGVPATGWDDLPYEDFIWMRIAAEQHVKQQEQQSKA